MALLTCIIGTPALDNIQGGKYALALSPAAFAAILGATVVLHAA
jgi:hypothetical protein